MTLIYLAQRSRIKVSIVQVSIHHIWHDTVPFQKYVKYVSESVCVYFVFSDTERNQHMQNNLLLLMVFFRKLCFSKANVGERF